MSTDSLYDSRLRDRQLVLAAGDAGDIPELEMWLNSFTTPVFGAVFIEVFAPYQRQRLWLPQGVSCTWLCRETSRRGYLPGWGRPRGFALREAVSGWFAEWAVADVHTELQVFAGAASSSVMQSFWSQVARDFAQSHNRRERYV